MGTLARYGISGAISKIAVANFPYGTFTVNMIGCFLVGFLDILAERKFNTSPQMRLLFVTGFCGALTTFSAFILESYSLMRAGEMFGAAINIFASVMAGLLLFRLGILLGEIIF